jgi:predicted outer membrane protein
MKFLALVSLALLPLTSFAFDTQLELGSFLNHQDKVEIALSNMAIEKSSDAKILSYAKRVVANHTLANIVLLSVSNSEKLVLSNSGEFDATLGELCVLEGTVFDHEYARVMVAVHEKALMSIDTSIKIQNSPIGAFSSIIRARVQSGLEMARQL